MGSPVFRGASTGAATSTAGTRAGTATATAGGAATATATVGGAGAGAGAEPEPSPDSDSGQSPLASYPNCKAAKAAGAAPLYRGDPGYSSKLDRDGDGVACES